MKLDIVSPSPCSLRVHDTGTMMVEERFA